MGTRQRATLPIRVATVLVRTNPSAALSMSDLSSLGAGVTVRGVML
jgi:hypothetical protein